MNMKRQLHTLYIKHDGQFKTLSKMALGQIILKIVHLQKNGATVNAIQSELQNAIIGSISVKDIISALDLLVREKKINKKRDRYFLSSKVESSLNDAEQENRKLHDYVLNKYFSKSQSKSEDIAIWFQDTTIKFFETFSFEWFHQMTYKGKNVSNNVPNLRETLTEVLVNAKGIVEEDKEWLKTQYNKFIDSEDANENLLFWQYGISMFASRLITARNYADEISIDMFRDSKFILDTNILMILDLEGHELSASLKALEKVLKSLNISPCYFGITRDEYIRAMNWRKTETIRVFNNYTVPVLKVSDCPFIQTAIKRHCVKEEDLIRMFDQLMDIQKKFNDDLPLTKYEYAELNQAIEAGQNDENLKSAINEVYKRRTKRDKRENPIMHDAGMVRGIEYLRKSEEKSWIVTSDSTLKIYALEHTVRDENELVVGLDVILGVMAINSGGVDVEASNFAPLFKNIIKYALIPQSSAFELQDLAFILSTDTRVNELPNDKVIEAAREVKKMRIAGIDEEQVALYLRRIIEGEKVGIIKDILEVKEREQLTISQRDKIEKEKNLLVENYRINRRGELQDQYKKEMWANRYKLIIIPLLIGVLIFFAIKVFAPNQDGRYQFVAGCIAEAIFSLLIIWPFNKRINKKYSTYVTAIEETIEREIADLKNRAND